MGKPKRKTRPRPQSQRPASLAPRETQTSVAATVGWTVTVTMVVACDVAAIAAHVYVIRNPEAKGAAMFGGLMLFAGAIIGVVSLGLLPVVYRVRRTPPPTEFVVFAVCAAVAPILALIARSIGK